MARALRVAAGRRDAPLRARREPRRRLRGRPARGDTPLADFEAQFALNLRPTYLVSQAALPRSSRAGGGAICCVSTRAALHPFAGAAGYCASKAALITFARVVAPRARADGVRCNVDRCRARSTRRPTSPRCRPSGTMGSRRPREIAAVIRFLCGEESAPTSGAAVPVYGGA